jgi:hypothetical protein
MGRTGCGMDKLGAEYSAEQRKKAKGVARTEQDKLNRVAPFARTAAGSARRTRISLGKVRTLASAVALGCLPQV